MCGLGNGCVPPSVLLVLVNEHLLKDNLALEFVLEVFATLKAERGVASLVTALKKGQLEGRSVITFNIVFYRCSWYWYVVRGMVANLSTSKPACCLQ